MQMLCTVAKCLSNHDRKLVVKVVGRLSFLTLQNVNLIDLDWSDVCIGTTLSVHDIGVWNMHSSTFHETSLQRSCDEGDFVLDLLDNVPQSKSRPKWSRMKE